MMKVKIVAKSLIVGPEGGVLVLRRSKNDAHSPGRVDLPGGAVDPGESYAAAAARELQEEAGLELEVDSLRLVHTYTITDQTKGEVVIRLLFVGHTGGIVRLSEEHDEYWWKSLDELRRDFASTPWGTAIDSVLASGLIENLD
jgi:8-oxo-dGTP diphosphatase